MVSPKDLQKEIMEDYKEIEAIFTGESAKLIFKNYADLLLFIDLTINRGKIFFR